MRSVPVTALWLLLCGLLPAADHEFRRGTQEFGGWAGYSPGSVRLIGSTPDRQLLLVAVNYGVVFAHTRRVAFQYTATFLPVINLYQPRAEGAPRVTGWGFAPVGVRFLFRRQSAVRPFAEWTGGMSRHMRNVPIDDPNATNWNFTFDLTGGLHMDAGRGRAVQVGYRFHHLSNANAGRFNPGLDSNVIYAGFSFVR